MKFLFFLHFIQIISILALIKPVYFQKIFFKDVPFDTSCTQPVWDINPTSKQVSNLNQYQQIRFPEDLGTTDLKI